MLQYPFSWSISAFNEHIPTNTQRCIMAKWMQSVLNSKNIFYVCRHVFCCTTRSYSVFIHKMVIKRVWDFVCLYICINFVMFATRRSTTRTLLLFFWSEAMEIGCLAAAVLFSDYHELPNNDKCESFCACGRREGVRRW